MKLFVKANRHLLLPSPVPAYKLTGAPYQFPELQLSCIPTLEAAIKLAPGSFSTFVRLFISPEKTKVKLRTNIVDRNQQILPPHPVPHPECI